MKKEQFIFIIRVMKVLQWRVDCASGEMIESRYNGEQYCKDHLSVKGSISQDDLETICTIVNNTFETAGSNLRVVDSMGEFVPACKNTK